MNTSSDKEVVVYKTASGDELPVRTDGETVWMTVDQMVLLLGRDRTVILRHVNNAIQEGELNRSINVQKLHNIQSGRGRPLLIYDLDVLISVGYRVKSPEGVRFRRWATRILREMLLKRVDEVREIAKLRRRMDAAEGDIKQIKGGMSYLVKQLSAPETPRRKVGFGASLARRRQPPTAAQSSLHSNLLRGTFRGSLRFQTPEFRSDQFSGVWNAVRGSLRISPDQRSSATRMHWQGCSFD